MPPFSAAEVRATLERQYGKPVDQVFEEFSFVPLAAASLGQVHFAKVGGKRVVVKVQRPGLKALFDVDLKNVRVIAQWLQVRSWPDIHASVLLQACAPCWRLPLNASTGEATIEHRGLQAQRTSVVVYFVRKC